MLADMLTCWVRQSLKFLTTPLIVPQKVPASGAAPVFKLTLPHRIVSSYLSHLVEMEFEIVSSANMNQCWQGTIAPRRNKDRSEYTLQV